MKGNCRIFWLLFWVWVFLAKQEADMQES